MIASFLTPTPNVGHHPPNRLHKTHPEGRQDAWEGSGWHRGRQHVFSWSTVKYWFCSLACKSPARCKKLFLFWFVFFLLILLTFPFQTEEFLFNVHLLISLRSLTGVFPFSTEGSRIETHTARILEQVQRKMQPLCYISGLNCTFNCKSKLIYPPADWPAVTSVVIDVFTPISSVSVDIIKVRRNALNFSFLSVFRNPCFCIWFEMWCLSANAWWAPPTAAYITGNRLQNHFKIRCQL